METFERLCLERGQLAGLDRRARARSEPEQEAEIVQGEETKPEQLLLVDEMTDVRAREPGAGGAVAALVERPLVAREAGVLEVEAAVRRERSAGSPHPRRQDAIEHVDPSLDHLQHALRVADPHE